MIDATEWLVCAFASQERAKVRTSGNPLLFRRMDPRLRGGDKKRVIPAGLRHSRWASSFPRRRESIPSSRRCTTRCLLSSASQDEPDQKMLNGFVIFIINMPSGLVIIMTLPDTRF